MNYLLLGLILFLGIHSTRIFAPTWRERQIARFGAGGWKGLYTLLSLIGFGLILWGYGEARTSPMVLWNPPVAMRHVAALLTLLAFTLIVAAYVPRNHLKAKIGHPMYAGVKLWAFAHLLANGTLADALLFGGFLAWSVLGFVSSRKRDRAAGVTYPAGEVVRTVMVLVIGIAAWAGFALWAHGAWIGVRPFG
jgi:uncharacterized membrane protein